MRYALVLNKQGKLEAARAHLRQIEASSDQARAQLLLTEAQMLRDANRPLEAFDLIGGALNSMPDQPDLLYDYAMLAEKLERMDLLETNLKKLISLQPDHAHAYNALGYSLAERNLRLPEAQELIEKALQLSPDDPFIIDSMGWVLYRMGKSKQALEYLRKAYSARPDPEIAAHLGEVLWVAGEHREAEKIWLEATKKNTGQRRPQQHHQALQALSRTKRNQTECLRQRGLRSSPCDPHFSGCACCLPGAPQSKSSRRPVSYTHLRAHETRHDLVCRLL